MSKGTEGKDKSDIEKEFEEDLKEGERRQPEEAELEGEFDEELEGEEWPEEKKLDPFAEKFYELSSKKFKTENELDTAVNGILNEIERDYFFKGLLKKTGKSGRALLKKGLRMFKGVSAFQAAEGITQLVRGNLKGTLGTLAKSGLKVRAGAAALPVLSTLGFESGETNRDAWQNFVDLCKESFDYLASNLNENADDPIKASKLASEAFSDALKEVKSERRTISIQRMRRMTAAPSQKKVAGRTLAIVLGLACIVLAAGLVGSIVFFTPQIADRDNTISSLNDTISSMNNTISSLNREIQAFQTTITQMMINQTSNSTSDNQTITNLNSQISDLTSILYLNESGYLVANHPVSLDANANATVFTEDVGLYYAGYITVSVQSNSTTTYVQVVYSYHGVNYDNTITVGTSGTAAFPVLPSPLVIILGNTETVDTVDATVTATYYY
jgi:cell division protein FtsL